jgi:hypothetical protein
MFGSLSHELLAESQTVQNPEGTIQRKSDPIEELQDSNSNQLVNQIQASQPRQQPPLFRGISHELLAQSQTIQNHEPIQAKEADSASVSEVQPENKTGLPDQLKAGIENLSGIGMDDVMVHYNSPKPADVQALAYTQGTDIHVASGQEKHLPHEAWHIVQQKQGRVKPSFKLKNGIAINDSPNLEREADIMGSKANTISHKVHRKATTESNSLVQSPITTNSPQQLTSASSSNGDVIQRVPVATWGGTFSDSNYAPKRIGGSVPEIGASIKITFAPNGACPENVKIGLIQIVRVIGAQENSGLAEKVLKPTERWAIDRASDSNPVYGSEDASSGKKSKELTDNPPSVSRERQDYSRPNSPMIDVGAQLGERRENSVQNAILFDDPSVFLNVNEEQSQLFETTAVVLEGPYKGLALGTVSWGWRKIARANQAVLEPFQLVQDSGSSQNFEDARKVWNKAAKEHELVPIPTIRNSSYRPPRKDCFLTTACVEYMGLSDDCEELTTLRRFRDTYLLSKSNGKELIELYYEHSPKIVAAIHEQENKEEILKGLYRIIRQCVDSIQKGDNEWAYQTYCKMVIESKEKFIPKCLISIPSY